MPKLHQKQVLWKIWKHDSLDLFQIINDIEDEFDVKIENTDEIKTVADVVKIVEENQQ